MKYPFILFVLLMVILSSCSQNSTSSGDDPIVPQWNAINIEHVYYDSLHIESQDKIKIGDQSVKKIILFLNDNGEFVPQDTIVPSYEPSGDAYYLNFQFSENINHSIIDFNFRLEYHHSDNSITQVDSTTSMLKYPYSNTTLFITTETVSPDNNPILFQDIDLDDNYLFFHPTAAEGLYEYSFSTDETTELVGYSSGDYIAHDSNYVFIEMGHFRLFRYNLSTDTIDLEINLNDITYSHIEGLECYNGNVYIIVSNYGTDFTLGKYDYSGNYISSTPYINMAFFLTIEDDIAYSVAYADGLANLSRYDLKTGGRLPDKALPTRSKDLQGIRIFKDNFYFADWSRQVICVMPFSNLE